MGDNNVSMPTPKPIDTGLDDQLEEAMLNDLEKFASQIQSHTSGLTKTDTWSKEVESRIQALDRRPVAQLGHLKNRIPEMLKDGENRLKRLIAEEQVLTEKVEAQYDDSIAITEKTIASLEKQLETVRSELKMKRTQRERALLSISEQFDVEKEAQQTIIESYQQIQVRLDSTGAANEDKPAPRKSKK